jgi:DNA-binding NarL/FixJ family response regulator
MGGFEDPGSNGALRVVVVDDHEVLRAGTRQVLETTEDIVVIGEADT